MQDPKLQKVIHYLKTELSKKNCEKLPSVRDLSLLCGVSLKTAHKAVKRLSQDGVIDCRWGSGIFPLKDRRVEPTPYKNSSALNKSDSILEQIEKDLLNNIYRRGEKLPSIKTLVSRFNTSYPTIKKVFQKLISKDLIQSRGYTYYFTESFFHWKVKIGVISAVDTDGKLIIEKERERNFFRQLSIEADRRNIQLEYIGFSDWNVPSSFRLNRRRAAVQLTEDPDMLGYILVSWHMRDYKECLNRLVSLKKPISVWLENSIGLPQDNDSTLMRPISFFDLSYSLQPGLDMGRFLLRSGHRKIAFISPFHGSTWSQQRLTGLKEAFVSAGIRDGVKEYTNSDFTDDWSFMNQVLERNDLEMIINTKLLQDKFSQSLNSERLNEVIFEINSLFRDHRIFQVSESLMNAAINDRTITAWVAANDLCAIQCLNYLNRSVSVPDKISLVGFDNSFQSLKLGLTSYDFNTSGLAQSMIDYILNPTSSLYDKHSRVINLNGKVVVRDSVKNL